MSEQETIHYMQETIEHQHQQIADLSDMLIMQGKDIKALRDQLLKLQGKMEMLETADGSSEGLSVTEQAALNKPPHY